jgi:hypothetical protein
MSNTQAALDILKTAKNLIATKGHTKGEFARDAKGEWAMYDGPDAACFCALGAIRAACPVLTDAREEANSYLEEVVDLRNFSNHIPTWNDAPERTAGEVIHAFSLAIQLAEKDLAEETCAADCKPFAHTEKCS